MTDLQLKIQRLVHGELSAAERTAMLVELPADSKIWKQLAIAFLEQQVFSEALGAGLGSENCRARTGSSDRPIEAQISGPAPLADPQRATVSGSNLGKGPLPAGRRTPLRDRLAWIAALACCYLVGMGIGRGLGIPGEGQVASPSAAASPAKAFAESEMDPAPPARLLPLADALARSGQPIPVALRRELLKCGYMITELDRVSKVQLPTGQTVDMPVRSVAVTYLGNSAFQ